MRRFVIVAFGLSLGASVLVGGVVAPGSAGAAWNPEEIGTAQAPPVFSDPVELREAPPNLTDVERQRLEEAADRSHLPGPILDAPDAQAPLGPAPAAATRATLAGLAETATDGGPAPRAAGDFLVYRNSLISRNGVLGSNISNIAEVTHGQAGRFAFAAGNWWAARSTNGGRTWAFVDPNAGPFPAHSPFCCDQVVNYDPARNFWIWQRMGSPGIDGGGNFENVFILSIGSDAFGSTSCHYVIEPTDTRATWTDQWWDYAHAQLTEDFYYLAWNMFDGGDNWTRTVMLQIPLDELANCLTINYSFVQSVSWFTFVPVSGTDSRMYWASNWPSTAPQNSRLGIWRWDEIGNTVGSVVRTVTPWTFTGQNDASCGTATRDWAARSDQRVLTGTRFEYQDPAHRGRDVLAWWWNVAQDGDFPRPYIEAAAFYLDDLSQVPGFQGRPLIWNSSQCFQYPSAAANDRGDHALVFHMSGPTLDRPAVGAAIADDYVADPPGYTLFTVRISTRNPQTGRWGDYNTLRVHTPSGVAWTGGAHTLRGTGNCCDSAEPLYFSFGRERDLPAWQRWERK